MNDQALVRPPLHSSSEVAYDTGTFTADARKEATRDGAPAIDLIDGEGLCLLLKERGLGVLVRPVVKEEIEIDHLFFEGI